MKRMKESTCHTTLNGIPIEPHLPELRAGDDPVLPARDRSHLLPARRWVPNVADSATSVAHLARVAPQALRVGDLCNERATTGTRGP